MRPRKITLSSSHPEGSKRLGFNKNSASSLSRLSFLHVLAAMTLHKLNEIAAALVFVVAVTAGDEIIFIFLF